MEDISFQPQNISDQFAAGLNLFANNLQRPFWYCEQNLHRYAANPLEEDQLTESVAYRIFKGACHGVGLALGAFPAAFSFGLKGLSNYFHTRDYLYIQGRGEELNPSLPYFFHLNACMFPGGLPMSFGGVRPAGERWDEFKEFMHGVNPDIFFLCEFSQTMTPHLVADFEERYPHIFANIGTNAKGMDASMACVSRIPILSQPRFHPSQTVPDGEQKASFRGYFHVETEKVHYLYTHLHPKETDRAKEIRQEQLDEIKAIAENPEEKPWVILGDINIQRGSEGYQQMLDKGFRDLLAEQHGMEVETCINGLEKGVKENPESIDMVLVLGDLGNLQIQTAVHDTYENPRLSLSDHKGIGGKFVAV